MLEDNGAEVHLPHRDTDQTQNGLGICRENAMAIFLADEIHIFYNPISQGTHFDMGVVFALDQLCGHKKTIKLVSYSSSGKVSHQGFTAMLDQWILDKVNNGEQELEFEYEYDN
jgi:hypothetical protein